jgi:hypothetical protein
VQILAVTLLIALKIAQALFHAFNEIRSDFINQRSTADWLSDAVSICNRVQSRTPVSTTCEVKNSAGKTQSRCRRSGKNNHV